MSFQIGDRIAHPLHGAGVIDRIESRRIGRESREYFVLKLQGSGMVVMVPKNACDEVGVRPIGHGIRPAPAYSGHGRFHGGQLE